MLLKQKLNLFKMIGQTWKLDLFMLLFCTIIYLMYTNLLPTVNIPPAYPAFLGIAVAFFIGFNNTQAYKRWWEARTIWGGIVNDSRSWARSLLAYSSDFDFSKKMITLQLAFVNALSSSLLGNSKQDYFQYIDTEEKNWLVQNVNIPNAILELQAYNLAKLRKDKSIDDFVFFALNLNLCGFSEGMGKSERINNTVFPVAYVYFTRLLIWVFIGLVTMSTSNEAGLVSIVLGWVIGFVFYTTHLNGLSLMDPFEDSPASVPILSIVRTIEINLLQAINSSRIPDPLSPINGEYIL